MQNCQNERAFLIQKSKSMLNDLEDCKNHMQIEAAHG